MNYNKTWEVMSDLEDSFNRIIALEKMIDDLNDAVSVGDQESIAEVSEAMKTFMPVYIRQYEKASHRAWNNTVREVAKVDNPYKTSRNAGVLRSLVCWGRSPKPRCIRLDGDALSRLQ